MAQNLKLFVDYSDPIQPGPFVKWAGGKSKLLADLKSRMPTRWNRYFEPFLGGGAFFFDLQPTTAFLSDVNEDLVNAYQVVQNDVERLIRDLKRHQHSEEYFYQLRDADRLKSFKRWSAVRKASRLIYLNKTCFNGLYRVNNDGFFNVPFGQYKNPRFCDPELLRACNRALAGVTLTTASFEEVLYRSRRGDFVYFDPPYAPLSATSTFTSYAKGGFKSDLQVRLRDVCEVLSEKGVQFMLSNSHTPLILDLYKDFKIETVYAARAINSKGSARGKVKEVLVTNY